jgi:hypothetical protein
MVLRLKKPYTYLLFLSLFFLGCVARNESPQGLVKMRCSRCHTLERIYAAKKDAGGWLTTVKKMEFYASGVIREEEIPIIVDYLAKTQGIEKGEGTQSSGQVK